MTKEYLKLYKALLFNLPQTAPALKTYAIVDSARDEHFKETVMLSGLPYVDLWHEKLWELENERPLYLVALEEKNLLAQRLLEAYDKSIATYFISPYTLDTLKSYYSFFTYVRIEEEPELFSEAIFGFYDPNILPQYIQTLYTREKTDEFFAGAAMWLAPHPQKEESLYIAYRTREGEAKGAHLQLARFVEEKSVMLCFDECSFPSLPELEAYVHEVIIDHKQVQYFDEIAKIRFIDGVFEEYKKEGYVFYHDEKIGKQKAFQLFDEAKSIGIQSEGGVYRYILLGLSVPNPMHKMPFYDTIVSTNEKEQILLMNDIMNAIRKERRRTNGV